MKETVLKFVVEAKGNPMEFMSRFHPQGQTVLNRTMWRGKESRSCAVTRVKSRPYTSGGGKPILFDVEVSYRPKGCITYVGGTKYDGWTAMILDRTKEGVLLDGHGQPLPEGQPPVYLPYELYGDVEYNDIDFGEFLGEFPVGIQHVKYADLMRTIQASGNVNIGGYVNFTAPRRNRPMAKIMLSNAPSGTGVDEWRTRIINVNSSTPHLQQVVLDHVTELVSGFVEGRYSMKTLSNDDFTYINLDDVLVDCTPNERGEASRFDILREYLTPTYLDDLAKRLISIYAVDVQVVDDEEHGLVIRHANEQK